MTEVGIGLGSNLGDRCGNIIAALLALRSRSSVRLTRISDIYETPPWGVVEQPAFLNAAALLETSLSPDAFLEACKEIERLLGREVRERWGPREIDIDLLFFGDVSVSTDKLTLPHPCLFERLFVLVPLCEIAGEQSVADRSLSEALSHLAEIESGSDVRLNPLATSRMRSAFD